MGKHRKSTRRGKLAPLVTTGLALEVAGVLTAAYALNPTISEVGLAAASHTIFVDGTKSIFGTDVGDPADRMRDSFGGRYDFAPDDTPEFVDYPGTLGLASIVSNGLGAPTFDASEQLAVDDLIARVKADQTSANPSAKLYVVGYSQGGGAVVRAVNDLENTEDFDYDASKVIVVIAANPRRNDGGLLTRFPAFTLPLVGATFGGGTATSETKIIQVTKQYDGVADAPVYFLNVVADANAILGYVYLHSGYYQDVLADPEHPPAGAIVTTSSSGRVTDVLLPNRPGELPLTRPLLSLGVPQSVVTALDPFLRAIIETGYDRPVNGSVTSDQPVGFKLLPGPDKWVQDAQSVAGGAAQTAQALASPAVVNTPVAPGARLAAGPAATTDVVEKSDVKSVSKTDPKVDPKTQVKPDPSELVVPTRKFTPARAPEGGWKPGMLLRNVRDAVNGALGVKPTPTTDPTSAGATTGSTPEKAAESTDAGKPSESAAAS